MANHHQILGVTKQSLIRIKLILSGMGDSQKLQLCSFVLDNLEDFRHRREITRYSHCPVPASTDERHVVGGQLQFSEDGKEVDCTKTQGGKIIPNLNNVAVDDMKSSTGEFILVVQRYEIFRRLAAAASKFIVVNIEEDLDSKMKLFLPKLKKELKLPILALVDSSPDGLKIISTVSKCCGGCDVGWIGKLPSVLDEGMFAIPNEPRIRIPMTDSQSKTLDYLMKKDVFMKKKMSNPKWFNETILTEMNLNTLIQNPFFEEERKNKTWIEELTLMNMRKTITRVEDFDDLMSMLYTMLILAYRQEPARAV